MLYQLRQSDSSRANSACRNGTSTSRRVHSLLSVRIERSMTAMLPYLPTAQGRLGDDPRGRGTLPPLRNRCTLMVEESLNGNTSQDAGQMADRAMRSFRLSVR